MKKYILTILALWLQVVLAQLPSSTRVEFISEVEQIVPGEPFSVAVVLHHPDEWHSYYTNAGDSGYAPRFKWELPDGFSVSDEPIWPTPHYYEASGLVSYIYEGSPAFEFVVTPAKDLVVSESPLNIKVMPSWLLCKEQCVQEPPFGKKIIETVSVTTGNEVKLNASNVEVFKVARAQHPEVVEVGRFPVFEKDGHFYLKIPKSSGTIHFFEKEGNLSYHDRTISSVNGHRLLKLTISEYADLTVGQLDKKISVFGLSKEWSVLVYMFLGGLVLNLMPCVFPVIGIKVMSFVKQAGGSKKETATHSLIFVSGILISFWVLVVTLYSLRLYFGDTIGWGFQLQNPWVIWGMIILFLLLALNMAGVFEMGTSLTSAGNLENKTSGKLSSFLSGVLTTVIATPCSGPFLGAAIGATIQMPFILFFISFTMMALGLSLPYLVLALKPEWINMLPKPGRWMETLKQGLSFLLFMAVVYLIWVYLAFQMEDWHLATLLSIVAIAFAAWIWGRYSTPANSKRARYIGVFLSVAILLGSSWVASPKGFNISGGEAKLVLEWEKWSPEKVEASLAEGKPVFIDFTARWCNTCQTNKARAYSAEVQTLLKKHDVVLYKADKTRPTPEIEKALAKLNRTAIPVNVLYTETGASPQISPTVLSPSILKEFLETHLE